jgi:hypothetical protein
LVEWDEVNECDRRSVCLQHGFFGIKKIEFENDSIEPNPNFNEIQKNKSLYLYVDTGKVMVRIPQEIKM